MLGLQDLNTGVSIGDTVWLVGTDVPDIDARTAEDLGPRRPGFLYRLGPDRLWSPVLSEDLIWDVVLLQLREMVSYSLRRTAIAWLGQVSQQLEQMTGTLTQRNRVVWAQERDDVERFDVNFHSFAVSCRAFLSRNELPGPRSWTAHSGRTTRSLRNSAGPSTGP